MIDEPETSTTERATSIIGPSLSLLAANIGGGLIAFVFVVAIARSVGPGARGVVAFVTTIPTVISLASLPGLDIAFLYFAGSRPELRRAITTSAIVWGVIFGIIGAFVGGAILRIFPGLVPPGVARSMIVLGLATTPLLSIQRLMNSLFIGSRRIGLANAVVLAIPAVSLVSFVLVGGAVGFTSDSAIIAWTVGRVVGAILAIVLAVRAIGLEGGASLRETTRRSFGYGLRAYPSSLATLPIRRFDTLVLGATGQTTELGLYTAGVNIAETAMYLPNSVANVLLPESAGQHDPARAAVLVRKASVVVMTIMIIGGGLGILLAPWIVHTLFGSAYGGSVLPLQLMMVAMLGQSTRRVYGAGLMARNKAGTVSILTVTTMVMIVALDLVLIPHFGANGAALASAIAYCVGGAAVFTIYRRRLTSELRATLPSPAAVWKESFASVSGVLRTRRARSVSASGNRRSGSEAPAGGSVSDPGARGSSGR
jgi:O-antigen/teichoic acid export membrane protein